MEMGPQLNKWGMNFIDFLTFFTKKYFLKKYWEKVLLGRVPNISYFFDSEVPGGVFDTTRWLLMGYYQAYARKRWLMDPQLRKWKFQIKIRFFCKKYFKIPIFFLKKVDGIRENITTSFGDLFLTCFGQVPEPIRTRRVVPKSPPMTSGIEI